MSDFRIDKITNRDGSAGTQIAGISTFSGTSGMQLPAGPTEYRGGRGRGLFGSGANPSAINVIDMIEIATKGNSTDFGDDNLVRQEGYASFASPTRGIFAGGSNDNNMINFITVASTGNGAYFGDITSGGGQSCMGGGCNHTRGVMGGTSSPNNNNTIEYLTIAQLGNTIDFGDLSANRGCGGCVSNAHGGL